MGHCMRAACRDNERARFNYTVGASSESPSCECPCAGCAQARGATSTRLGSCRPTPGPPVREAIIGFSTGYQELIAPNTVVTIGRSIRRGLYRGKRLEMHTQSAMMFDMEECRAGGSSLMPGPNPICLAVFPSSLPQREFAPRVMLLATRTLREGDVIEMTFRNTGNSAARFRANLIGIESLP